MASLHRKLGLLILVPVIAVVAVLVYIAYQNAPRADEIGSERYAQYIGCIQELSKSGYYSAEKVNERCSAIYGVNGTPTPVSVITGTSPLVTATPVAIVTDYSTVEQEPTATPTPIVTAGTTTLGTTTTPTPSPSIMPTVKPVTPTPSPVVTVTPSPALVTPEIIRQTQTPENLKDLYWKTNRDRTTPYTADGHSNPRFQQLKKDPNYTYTNGQFVYTPEYFKELRNQGYSAQELYAMCLTEYDDVYGRDYYTKNGKVYGVYPACNELTKLIDDAPKTLQDSINAYFSTYGTNRGHSGMPAQHCMQLFGDREACREAIFADKELYAAALKGANPPDDRYNHSTSWTALRLLFGHLPPAQALDECQKYTSVNIYNRKGSFGESLRYAHEKHGGSYQECIDAFAGYNTTVPNSEPGQLALLLGPEAPNAMNDILKHACDASPIGKKSTNCDLAAERYAAYRDANPDASVVDILRYVYTQDDLFNGKNGSNEFKENPKQLANFINEISRHIGNHYIDMKKADIRKAMGINENERTFRDKANDLLLGVIDFGREVLSR